MPDQPSYARGPEEVDEIIEGRPLRKACLIGCAILAAAFLLAAFLFMRVFFGSGPKRVSAVPSGFPADLALFRPEEAREINHYPGDTRSKTFRFMTAPVRFLASVTGQGDSLPDTGIEPSLAGSDVVSVVWTNMDAKKDDVLRFYAGSLKQVGAAASEIRTSDDGETAQMIGSTSTTNVSIIISDDPDTEALDTITLIVEYLTPNFRKEIGN
jgi:hypothetical protein